MRWTKEQYEEYCQRHAQADDTGVCATKPELAQGMPLVGAGKGEGKGRIRAKVLFIVHARRPLDWDNYRLKDLQDCLVKAGILDGDEWDILEGAVISKKAYSEAEEKTEVEIVLTPHQQ